MSFYDATTIINLIAVVITTRIWGLWGAIPYVITYALMAVFFK